MPRVESTKTCPKWWRMAMRCEPALLLVFHSHVTTTSPIILSQLWNYSLCISWSVILQRRLIVRCLLGMPSERNSEKNLLRVFAVCGVHNGVLVHFSSTPFFDQKYRHFLHYQEFDIKTWRRQKINGNRRHFHINENFCNFAQASSVK